MKISRQILALPLLVISLVGCATSSEEAPSNSESIATNPLPRPSDVVNNLQELSDFVDYGIFNHWDYVTVTLENYAIENLDRELAKVYWTAQLVDINPMITGKLFGDRLTIYFEYRPEQTLLPAATENAYDHGRDVTYIPYVPAREETFEDFAYKDYPIAVDVTTSDQLWYCLDQQRQPIPSPGSKAETYLAQCEDILRSIVDDTMSDQEKVKAIYDWGSYFLTYDLEAAVRSTSDAIAATYDAFYLEGVLDNQRGVCDAFSKLFTLLVNMEGILCKRVIGPAFSEYQNPVIGSVGHAWNLVQIDHMWYTIDPTGSNAIFQNEGVAATSHFFYLVTDNKHLDFYGDGYRRYAYPDIDSVLDYNYFSKTHYDPSRLPSSSNDLVMDDINEFIDYLTYAKSLPTNDDYPHLSAEVIINFETGSDFNAELDHGMTDSGWGSSWVGANRFNAITGRFVAFLR